MNNIQVIQAKQASGAFVMAVAAAIALAFPELAFAQDVTGAQGRVTSFFTNINSLLNVASIAIVTIAVIFAGYQIAFNHKRVGDVAPVLIGGFLIGAAAQIAKMLLPADVTSTTMVVGQMLTQYA
ncbi:type IV secretion system protein VirB2 [Pseudoxanthomonas japonensis]|uniref:TrbC/VirB2 family protein n=1 Tax=Pseudoxanthomonas TaxID=83618 RepID=UPI000781281C|nr:MULTISPECIES: TrbC/VirB2 family protein [Pseudoxanthomonas]MBL8257007.1 TrbC/VirB2 family protein [Pseudoxanthomonas mexicana]MDR7068016.1 type IV secretion system protein VirB2 [Pseudoxanthomonas japonensis]